MWHCRALHMPSQLGEVRVINHCHHKAGQWGLRKPIIDRRRRQAGGILVHRYETTDAHALCAKLCLCCLVHHSSLSAEQLMRADLVCAQPGSVAVAPDRDTPASLFDPAGTTSVLSFAFGASTP